MCPTAPSRMRHIIFFGETGSGKSSVINLLLGAGRAPVSNDSRPCTQVNDCYETSLSGRKYCLWDTRGLGEGRNNFLRAIWGGGSEKELKKFLKERHREREIDLLVYCVSGSRATNALVKNYNKFCTISRRLAAPVAIVVTRLEKEKNMEDWWRINASALSQLKMDFDEHACITACTGPHQTESKEKLLNLITRDYRWEPKESGSYFGSPVQISTPSAPSRHEGWMFKNLFKSRYRDNINDGSLHPRQRIDSSPSTTVSSTRDSAYYSVQSATDSELPTPTVVPPTPRSTTALTDILPINVPLQTSNEDISSIGSSPNSMFRASFSSSHTSQSEPSAEGFEVTLDNLSITNLTSTVKRRINYATYNGHFGDVWECDLLSSGSSRKVAVKAVKTKPDEMENHLKKLRRELRIWWRLDHRNIVPLLGVVSGFGHLPSMVSPWFCNGPLHTYVTDHALHPSERRCLLRDIATGLSYLHSRGIIHGDLHSGNVLVDDDGTACLTDFGLSFVDDFIRTSYLDSSICGNVVFADPALVKRVSDSPAGIIYPTKPCDVYSFGGLMLQVLSGKKPYDEIQLRSIHQTVMSGQRPQIPIDITSQDELLIRSCWDHVERNRPSAVTLIPMFQVDRQHKPSR